MEAINDDNSKEPIKDDTQFENADIDPGFLSHQEDDKDGDKDEELTSREDKREHNIDSNLSIKEMREGKEHPDSADGTDALNYKNDRENGAYNPKNI
jgi:hypothetical protein